MALDFVAWHDRTPRDHTDLFNQYEANGYRTVSLCVYRSPNNPLFASVMTKRPALGSEQLSVGNLTQWQSTLSAMAANGWGPWVVSATGPASSPLVAAVFRPMNPLPLVRVGLTQTELAAENERAWEGTTILSWLDSYGAPNDVRFAGIWRSNRERVAWNMDLASNPVGQSIFQQRLHAVTEQVARPAFLTLTPRRDFAALVRDDVVADSETYPNLDSQSYQSTEDQARQRGLMPVSLSASEIGGRTQFAAIFATSDEPLPSTFRIHGPISIPPIDSAMQGFLTANSIRGGALAITQDTRLVYAAGYTNAASTYPDVLPTTLFRLASVSKTVCALAIFQLLQEGKLTLDTTMQSILNLKTPAGQAPADSRFGCITVRHLLESTSSLWRGGMFESAQAASEFGQPLPATQDQLASHVAGLSLEDAPGSWDNVKYNNTAYFMLGQIVRRLRAAADFASAIGPTLLQPLQITRIRNSRSLLSQQAADEAHFHLSNIVRTTTLGDDWPSLQFSASVRTSGGAPVPFQYGGEDYEMYSSGGGMSAAVTDLARLVAAFSFHDKRNPMLQPDTLDAMLMSAARASAHLTSRDPVHEYPHGYYGFDTVTVDPVSNAYNAFKGGWLRSNQSIITFTTGGLGFITAINGNVQDDVGSDWLGAVSDAARSQDWGTFDFFPNYGMSPLRPHTVTPPPHILPLARSPFVAEGELTRLMNVVRRSMAPPPAAPR
jgi:CubicO group peptidase (beta-lactamase class C family)